MHAKIVVFGCWLMLALAAYPPACHANEHNAEAATLASLIAQPLPKKYCLSLTPLPLKDAATTDWRPSIVALRPQTATLPATFEQTDGRLERLIRSRRLALLTLMNTRSTSVFFGVNRRGRVGLHVDASGLMSNPK